MYDMSRIYCVRHESCCTFVRVMLHIVCVITRTYVHGLYVRDMRRTYCLRYESYIYTSDVAHCVRHDSHICGRLVCVRHEAYILCAT